MNVSSAYRIALVTRRRLQVIPSGFCCCCLLIFAVNRVSELNDKKKQNAKGSSLNKYASHMYMCISVEVIMAIIICAVAVVLDYAM